MLSELIRCIRSKDPRPEEGALIEPLVRGQSESISTVIPAKAGVQCCHAVIKFLDPVFQRGNDLLRDHQYDWEQVLKPDAPSVEQCPYGDISKNSR